MKLSGLERLCEQATTGQECPYDGHVSLDAWNREFYEAARERPEFAESLRHAIEHVDRVVSEPPAIIRNEESKP